MQRTAPTAGAARWAQVLSVDTALSIQSHPDKELAGRLHAERPKVTPTPHHHHTLWRTCRQPVAWAADAFGRLAIETSHLAWVHR